MSDSQPDLPVADDGDAAPRLESPGASEAQLEELRQLLLGRERQQLAGIKERIENPEVRAQDVGRVLPQAVTLATSQGNQLTRALTPSVESSLKESVRRDPSVLVNAIFPLMGPAIRKAIADTFSRLVQTLNQTLDHSFSLRGLQWRLEAARTGRSFAEVVLCHTLIFRVEQVYLIHRRTGLMLRHVTAPHTSAADADMVSGMLTAIQDFVRDSFQVESGDTLHTMEVGELNVWIESGPEATLAAVIRGQAPMDYRVRLQQSLERIHAELGTELDAFEGDAAPFERAGAHLEECLEAQFAASRRASTRKLQWAAAAALLLLLVWLISVVRENRRWSDYLGALRAEEGIVLTEARQGWRTFYVRGLRDPLAADPAELLRASGLKPERVRARWEPYQAMSVGLVLRRAQERLQPPAGVQLTFENGVLLAEGSAPRPWLDQARRLALSLPGVERFQSGRLQDDSLQTLSRLRSEVEKALLFFGDGDELLPGQEPALQQLAMRIRQLREAATGGRRLRIVVTGHADRKGTEELNQRVSRQRAETIAAALEAQGLSPALFAVRAAGSREPVRADMPPQEEMLNRRVTFRVELEETGGAP